MKRRLGVQEHVRLELGFAAEEPVLGFALGFRERRGEGSVLTTRYYRCLNS